MNEKGIKKSLQRVYRLRRNIPRGLKGSVETLEQLFAAAVFDIDEAECPKCSLWATTSELVVKEFGIRRMSEHDVDSYRAQSYCRSCRSSKERPK